MADGNTVAKQPMHVLIAGGGIVGLTIAQGCRENGIPYTLFERDTEGEIVYSVTHGDENPAN